MKELKAFIVSFIVMFVIANGFSYISYLIRYGNMKRKSVSNDWKKASKALGIRVKKLKKMSKREIKNVYRELAKKHHPDKGGNADKFRNIHEAYEFVFDAVS